MVNNNIFYFETVVNVNITPFMHAYVRMQAGKVPLFIKVRLTRALHQY